MRRYRGFSVASVQDPKLRDILSTIDLWIRDADPSLGKSAPSPINTAGTSSPPSGGGSEQPPGTYQRGDIAVGIGPPSNGLTRLPIGPSGWFLTSNALDPFWTDPRNAHPPYLFISPPNAGLIQAALDQLVLGGVLWLGPGVYNLPAPLIMRTAGITLRGSGKTSTILVYSADPNQDIITMTAPSCTVEHLSIFGQPNPVNGNAVPGTGRGIMLAVPDGGGSIQNRRPTIRSVAIACTPSWCIFDPGVQEFNGQSHGTCPGNHWTATLPTGASPLVSSGFALSINLTIEDCDLSFWGSNGCIFVGSATTWPTISRVKTSGYTYNTFSTIADPIATFKNAMGGIFLFNTLGAVIDNNYLQSSGDGGILPDKDAVMFSCLNGNNIWLTKNKWEVLGSSTGCADSNNGAGGREFYFITAAGGFGVTVEDNAFITRIDDVGSTLSNYGAKIIQTDASGVGGTGFTFKRCAVSHKRTRDATYSGPKTAADPVTLDRNDFRFCGAEGQTGYPTVLDEVTIVNDLGGVREVAWPVIIPAVADCSTPGVSPNLTTTTGDFSPVNKDDVVSGAGITPGTRVLYVTSTTTIILDQNANVAFPTPITFTTACAPSFIHRDLVSYKDRRWQKIGRFSSCGAPINVVVANCSAAGVGLGPLTTTGNYITSLIRPGMRITGDANIRANTHVSSVTDANNLMVDLPFLGAFGPVNLTFEASEDDLDARWSMGHEGSGSAVFGFVQSGDLDDGMWVRSINDKQFRQVPYYRRRDSFFANPMRGDLNYKTGNESLHTYSSTDAEWKQVFSLLRLSTATGDLAYYSAPSTPARRAIGVARDVLQVTGGVPVWGIAAQSIVVNGVGDVMTYRGSVVVS